MNAIPPRDDRRNLWIPGALMLALGFFMVLLSQGVIEGSAVGTRRALFNDPRHWQLTAFGLVFALAGVSLWIPRKFEALGRFNAMALVLTIVFAGAGSVWYGSGGAALQKGGSMTAFLDSIANWFQSVGVHPMLGAFVAGVVIAFVFAYRRSPAVNLNAEAPAPAARARFADSGIPAAPTAGAKLTIDGRTVEVGPEIMAHIRNGNKIEAIKALRTASGLDLKAAKDIVDTIADSPAMR